MFADYIKVSSILDGLKLQRRLVNVERWWVCAESNGNECSEMSDYVFSSFCCSKTFDYVLDGCTLSRVHSIRDLGVILTSNMSPKAHINAIICAALKLFGSSSDLLDVD